MKSAIFASLEKARSKKISLLGLRGSSHAWFSSLAAQKGVVCCIVPDEHLVTIFEEDIRLFASSEVLTYPGYEIPPYTPLSPDQRTTAARLSTLYFLHENRSPAIVVCSIEAAMRRVIPRKLLDTRVELIQTGEDIDQLDLTRSLISSGYEQVALVRSVGDFSVRGGIIDIFPPPFQQEDGSLISAPLRLDFFGDTVESMRTFDLYSQRSMTEITEAVLLPATDILYDAGKTYCSPHTIHQFLDRADELNWDSQKTGVLVERVKNIGRFAGAEFFLPYFYANRQETTNTFFDYLPSDATILFVEPEACRKSALLIEERIQANFREALEDRTPALPPNELFLVTEQVFTCTEPFQQILLTDFADQADEQHKLVTINHQLLKQEIELQRKKRGLIAPLSDQIYEWQREGGNIVICCRSARHMKNLTELLSKRGHTITTVSPPLAFEELSGDSSLSLCDHPLSKGFSLPENNLHILSESELFGEMRLGSKKRKKKHEETDVLQFAELNDGEIIVHRDHGLGIYRGLVTMELQGTTNDFMLIEYRDGDKLYLPVDRMNLISKYEGLSDKKPKIDKLGTQAWKTVKSKVKEEVWKIAHELLDIYAAREVKTGRNFSPPGELYHELEESFPYDETPGQDKAITEVIDDLTSEKIMDRLICGDVGYGKTEVAVRGAFKVVEDGFQVAVLVPTTVLSEQHLKTFRERLQGFPVTIDCINRFRSTAEQKRIIKALYAGEIDIIIGTHRLLSKDIRHKNLGLLIVDEEHRFGVTHKEKIKKIKAEVDILTLTATPIPRTLQMSLLGIRDLSVISSPPEHRQPIKTFVARYDDLVIKEAIAKEMRRNGQTFIVHNRVKSISKMAGLIQKLAPEARVAIAHGQMAGKELEEIMVKFVNKDIDVLISTTIIESGLDIPSANTIIINRADMLGLAEIYQLRGRVGRSSLQSYAYLLVPSMDTLSKESKERLKALMDYNELGGGFKLAMSDLQIRGGGNLLGVSQSGHIAAIGYDLYLELLQNTVADLKSKASADTLQQDDLDPEINLQLSAYIPETYIPDIGQRYIAYRRISALSQSDGLQFEDLKDELHDRYGKLPEETANLFATVALKKPLARLRINKLEKGKDSLVFSFLEDTPLQPQPLLNYIQQRSHNEKTPLSRFLPDGRLIISTKLEKQQDICAITETILTQLTELTNE